MVVRAGGRRADQSVVMMVMMAHPRPTTGHAQAHARFFHYNKLTVSSAASRSRFRQVRRQHHFLRLRLFTLHLQRNTWTRMSKRIRVRKNVFIIIIVNFFFYFFFLRFRSCRSKRNACLRV